MLSAWQLAIVVQIANTVGMKRQMLADCRGASAIGWGESYRSAALRCARAQQIASLDAR